CVIWHNNGYIF
nr:immunoglobulin light chain junction region [Macaca mulatta]MPO08143.1 immunoglobulin light chain junction region [Macaca mulatta]MPO11417.1 immunoglobulin light chain junction region [Macaca mulatta]